MPEAEEPKRNIDERLDALTMNLELLYRDRIADREQLLKRAAFLEEQGLSIRHLRDSVDTIRDSVQALLGVVQSHENRLERIEAH